MRLSHIFVSLAPFALTAYGLPVSGSLSDISDDNHRHSNYAAPTDPLPGNAETNWGLRGEWNQNIKEPKSQSSGLLSEGSKRPMAEYTMEENRPTESLLHDSHSDESTKPESHKRQVPEDDATEVEAFLDNATQIDAPQDEALEADISQDNTARDDTSFHHKQEASNNVYDAEASSEIERRGSDKVDRRQKDPNKPIDFSLLTPCLTDCFWKFNHVAPTKLDKVSIKDWCEDKIGRWGWWLDFGPLQCMVGCGKHEPDAAKISREWFLANCGW